MKSLEEKDYHKDVKLTDDQWRRMTLWLDMNSNEICWIGNDDAEIAAQKAGKPIWPPIDVDQSNPTGVETAYPLGEDK